MNIKQLQHRCHQKIKDFHDLGEVNHPVGGEYIYIDRGTNILGVAHLDTWHQKSRKFNIDKSGNLTVVVSPKLDDRLGVHILLDVLPSLGIETDILLTTGEESGMSSAAGFTSEKQYNWIYSFDRRGSDVVRYQYKDELVDEFLESLGMEVNFGSYSCIMELGHLECQGINMGAGYHLEHSKKCFAIKEETNLQIRRFEAFYEFFKDIHLPHDYDEYEWSINNKYTTQGNYYKYGTYDFSDDTFWNESESCAVCGVYFSKDNLDSSGLCEYCDPRVVEDTPCAICGVFFSLDDLDHRSLCNDCSEWIKEDELAYWETKMKREH